MNLKKRLEKLGEHYKVPRDKLNLLDWSKAIKKAAKTEDSIEVLYDKTFNEKKEPTTIEAKAVEVKSEEKKELAPSVTSNHAHKVEVAAPVFNIHVPAPTINMGSDTNGAPWVYTLRSMGQHAFTFSSGTMFGVLIGKKVLNALGVM